MEINFRIKEILIIFEKLYLNLYVDHSLKCVNANNIDYNIYKDENTFNTISDSKLNLIGKISENQEYIYLRRENISSYDINLNKLEFQKYLKLMIDSLKEISDDIEIRLFNKSDYERFLISIFPNFFLKEKHLLKFFKDLWITIRSHNVIENIYQDLEERVNLSFYNISKRNYFEDDFELHKAVFENNLRLIRRICAFEISSHIYCDINEISPSGHTPLMLAIKLNNLDAINVLCDHDADIRHKAFEGDTSPLEYTLSINDMKILNILVMSIKKQKMIHWENYKYNILNSLKNLPNFCLDLKFTFDSNIFSIFTTLTPNNIYRISKCGGNVRIDSLSKSTKTEKGKWSIIIKEKGNMIDIYKLDHEKKISYDYIESIMSGNDDKKIETIIKEGLINSDIFLKNMSLSEVRSNREEKIINFICKKFIAKGSLYITKEIHNNKKKVIGGENIKFKNFSDYFNNGKNLRDKFLSTCIDFKTKEYKKFASTTKLKNSFKGKNLTLKLENSDSDDYEIEYIEKMKKNKNMKVHLKPLNITMWVSENFPIKISHFLPLIHILSLTSNEFSQLKSTLCSRIIPFSSLPLKISFPIGYSFSALLSVTNFNLKEFDDSLFELDYIDQPHISTNLDKEYAQDFYDKYYLEKNNISDNDSSISVTRMKETSNIFDDENGKKYETEYFQTERNIELTYESRGIYEINVVANGDEMSAKPLTIKLKNLNLEKVDCVASPSAKSQKILKDKDNIYKNSNSYIIDDDLDDIPSENIISKEIKFSNTPIKNCKHMKSKDFGNDDIQRTIKKNFNATLSKNYKNFFKYKSNLSDNKDCNINYDNENLSKSRNISKNNIIDKEKGINFIGKVFQFFNFNKK